MQPFKYGQTIAAWLLRLSLVVYLLLGNFDKVIQIDFQSLRFYLAFALVVFSVLLFVGGFISKPGLTVISGLIIFLISVYQVIVSFNGRVDMGLLLYFFPMSIGFYFLCHGNK